MGIIAFLEDFYVIVAFLLTVLGIAVAIFVLMVLYRLWGILGSLQAVLKSLHFHSRAIKETMRSLREFCQAAKARIDED